MAEVATRDLTVLIVQEHIGRLFISVFQKIKAMGLADYITPVRDRNNSEGDKLNHYFVIY